MESSVQPLVVDVVWLPAATDPASPSGAPHPVAEAIFREVTGDPDGRERSRTGIPVYFRRLSTEGPAKVQMADRWQPAEHRAVVLLADDALVATLGTRNAPAVAELRALQQRAVDEDWLWLPVILKESALRFPLITGEINAVRPLDHPNEDQPEHVAGVVALELHRLLAPDRSVQVLISYASADGAKLAQSFKAHIDADTHLRSFIDRTGILPGEDFATKLSATAIAGPVVAMLTDAYAASVWCGREVLLAKAAGQPVVVIDATSVGHERSFPYLGNGPVVRWKRKDAAALFRQVVRLAVRESLRRTYLPLRAAHIARLRGIAAPHHVLARAPELMTLVAIAGAGSLGQTILYPDPPVPSDELRLLQHAFPHLQLRTPTEVWA